MSATVMPTGPTAFTAGSACAPPASQMALAATRTASRAGVKGDLLIVLAEARAQVVRDPQRIGHDGQRGIHGAAGREEAPVDHVEVVELVRLAVGIERRCLRVVTEADGPVLVGDARQRDPL